MREHGVEMEDPKGWRGITGQVRARRPGRRTCEKAQEACQKYLPKISEADRKRAADQALEFAKCMRRNGVEDFPDPTAWGYGSTGGIGDDPDFKKAQEACQDIMGGPGLRSGKGA